MNITRTEISFLIRYVQFLNENYKGLKSDYEEDAFRIGR